MRLENSNVAWMLVFNTLPVSLEYIIGGGKLASPKLRCLGYLVLLNRCNTMQIRPASTPMPTHTPSSVGRSEFNSSRSAMKLEKRDFLRMFNQKKSIQC